MRRSMQQLLAVQPSMPETPADLITELAVDQLCLSPLNVRTNTEDAESTDALEASIAQSGLLNPLIVHPLVGADAPWGVLAGGRRLRAIQRLVERGDLPADWPISVKVVANLSDSEITELSLSENLLRRDLRPYEINAAVRDAHERGASVDEIAARCGQRLVWVRQQLRLGSLAPEIFTAYALGGLGLDEAMAYAATEDRALQSFAFAEFHGRPAYMRSSEAIRRWLKIGDGQLLRLLRHVTEDAYCAAGGRVEHDLFQEIDDARHLRIVDEDLLRRLSEEKLGAERESIRARAGRLDLRFVTAPPQFAGYLDSGLEISAFFDAKTKGKIRLPDGDVVATIDIDAAGATSARFWWASRKARRDSERASGISDAPTPTPTPAPLAKDEYRGAGDQTARAAVREEFGLSADGLQVVRSLRRELLRALLVDNAGSGGDLARDYLVWAQLRIELADDSSAKVGARGVAGIYQNADDTPPAEVDEEHLAACEAHTIWRALVESIATQPFITIAAPDQGFVAFLDADDRTKRLAATVLAGIALLRSANVAGWRIRAHDVLAERAGVSDPALRELWSPTPRFMALFPKMARLELAQPYVDPIAFRSWPKLDNAKLSAATAALFAEPMQCPEASRADAERWVHPMLRFSAAESAS